MLKRAMETKEKDKMRYFHQWLEDFEAKKERRAV